MQRVLGSGRIYQKIKLRKNIVIMSSFVLRSRFEILLLDTVLVCRHGRMLSLFLHQKRFIAPFLRVKNYKHLLIHQSQQRNSSEIKHIFNEFFQIKKERNSLRYELLVILYNQRKQIMHDELREYTSMLAIKELSLCLMQREIQNSVGSLVLGSIPKMVHL